MLLMKFGNNKHIQKIESPNEKYKKGEEQTQTFKNFEVE